MSLSAPVRDEMVNPEEAAWSWLESRWLNVEAGDDPNDRDYSADEMVDAFMAGRALTASQVEAGEVELAERLEAIAFAELNEGKDGTVALLAAANELRDRAQSHGKEGGLGSPDPFDLENYKGH